MKTTLVEPAGSPATEPADWLTVHADYLFRFAVGQVRDVALAEDLVQETFLAALRARDSFAGKASERTWLVSILRHKIYDHLRRKCRERATRVAPASALQDSDEAMESVVWLHEIASECAAPGRRMELEELRANLEQALGKLPGRLAQVFQLHEIEERPNAEICEHMNISESNLWVILHRARKKLRTYLAEWREPSEREKSRSLIL